MSNNFSINQLVEKVLSKVDLASLIGERVKLSKKSGYTVGLCPFHNEKTPSFVVYPKSYFCFGCKKSGDAISFVRDTQGVGFIEAIRYLASKYSISLPELSTSNQYKSEIDLNKKLFSALQHAQIIYTNNIKSSVGSVAREYLYSRHFTDKDIVEFGFGYSQRGSNVYEACRRLGLKDSEIEKTSLVTLGSSKSSAIYDFFQDRMMIPIYDSYSRLVGFSGRALSSDVLPKYKNSRETPLFVKSSILFGFYRAKEHIRKGAHAILVEGNIDVYRLWKEGFLGACAGMGTAINEGHLKQISYFTNEVYLILDGDFAGKKATISTIDIALKVPELNVKVCILPQGHDPDSFILEYGKDAFLDIIETKSRDLIDYVVSEVIRGASSLEIPHKVSTSIIPWLAQLKDPIQRSYLTTKISSLTGIDASELHRQLRFLISSSQNAYSGLKRKDLGKESSESRESLTMELATLDKEFIANLFLYFPDTDNLDIISEIQKSFSLIKLDEIWSYFVTEIILTLKQGKSPSDPAVYTKMSSYLNHQVVSFIDWVKDNQDVFATSNRSQNIMKVIKEYKKRYYQAEIEKLKQQLQDSSLDTSSILQSIVSLNKELRNI